MVQQTYPETQEHDLDFTGINVDFNLRGQHTQENTQESGVQFTGDERLPFDEMGFDPSYFALNAEDYVTNYERLEEDLPVIAQIPEQDFVEFVARLYLFKTGSERAMGVAMWTRLKEKLGFEHAKESDERNLMIRNWAYKINPSDTKQVVYSLDKYIRAAMGAGVDPRVGEMSVTAGSEIVGGIDSSNEGVVRDTVQKRADAVESLDPDMVSTTEAVRDAKQLEKNGNRLPKIMRVRNLNPQPTYPEWSIVASIKVGEEPDENGEIHDVMEMMEVAQISMSDPKAEEVRDQFKTWQKIIVEKWKYVSDFY